MRIPLLAALVLVSLGSSRVALADTPDLDAGPLHVDFKVEAPDHKAPLASGSMEMEANAMTEFESAPAGDPSRFKVQLFSRLHRDGTVAVWVSLDEVGAKGDKVKWQPSLQGKRGTPMIASVNIGNTARTITVTVR